MQEQQERARVGSRYEFGMSGRDSTSPQTKVCPRCGQVLFADMDVCYGCLYDFSRDRRRLTAQVSSQSVVPGQEELRQRGGQERADEHEQPIPAHPVDPLSAISLDELDEERSEASEPSASPSDSRIVSCDDTIDLSACAERVRQQEEEAAVPQVPRYEYCVELSMPAVCLRLPLPQDGMLVGRDPSCDLVLRSREVSRRHVILLPDEGGVRVRDCGATNPTLVNGRTFAGEEVFEPGVELCISDATFRVLRESAA